MERVNQVWSADITYIRLLKGVRWGLILWFLAQAVVRPMMGMGFFSAGAPAPVAAVLGSFLVLIRARCRERLAATLGIPGFRLSSIRKPGRHQNAAARPDYNLGTRTISLL